MFYLAKQQSVVCGKGLDAPVFRKEKPQYEEATSNLHSIVNGTALHSLRSARTAGFRDPFSPFCPVRERLAGLVLPQNLDRDPEKLSRLPRELLYNNTSGCVRDDKGNTCRKIYSATSAVPKECELLPVSSSPRSRRT